MRAFVMAVVTGVLTLLWVSTAHAQGVARSFDQLNLLVRPGETIIVRDSAGAEVRGRLDSLTPSSLVLRRRGVQQEFQAEQVREILMNRGDSLSNGALIGFAIGAGIAGLGLAAACAEDDDCGVIALAIPFYGGIGAGIGVGVDAMISRAKVVYRRDIAGFSLGLGPMVTRSPGVVGASATIGF